MTYAAERLAPTPYPHSCDGSLSLLPWDVSNLDALAKALEATYHNPDLAWRLYGKETVDELLEFITEAHTIASGYFWTVCKDGKPAGFIGVRHYLEKTGVLATGTYLAQEMRGGAVNGAIKDLVARASAQENIPLISSVSVENPRSLRAAQKLPGHISHEPVWEEIAGRMAYIYTFPTSFAAPSQYWSAASIDNCAQRMRKLMDLMEQATENDPPKFLIPLQTVVGSEEDPFHMTEIH